MSKGNLVVTDNYGHNPVRHKNRDTAIYVSVTERNGFNNLSAALSVEDATIARDRLTELIDAYNAVAPVEPAKAEILVDLPLGSVIHLSKKWQPVVKVNYSTNEYIHIGAGTDVKRTLAEVLRLIDDDEFKVLYEGPGAD